MGCSRARYVDNVFSGLRYELREKLESIAIYLKSINEVEYFAGINFWSGLLFGIGIPIFLTTVYELAREKELLELSQGEHREELLALGKIVDRYKNYNHDSHT